MNEPTLQVNQITANVADRRMLDGREYAVVPAVALVAGVVNNELAPVDEVARYLDAWNGRPLPVRHPRKDGRFVSANEPGVIANQVVGTFFNARMEGDRLMGELWVDVAKAQRLGGDALTVLERLEAGQPVEVSTAYFSDLEAGEGTWNGKQYKGIQRNLRPDHIALLPDEVGACSWIDGCGAPRVNCDCANKSAKEATVSANVDETKVTAPADAEIAVPAEDEAKDEEGTAGEQQPTPVANRQAPTVNAAQQELAEFSGLLREVGGVQGLRDILGGLKANADRQRGDIVGRLVANAACAFSRDDLAAMTMDQLEKLERSLTPASYAGRPAGGFSTNQAAEEWVPYERPAVQAA